jgi:hypothetical protein
MILTVHRARQCVLDCPHYGCNCLGGWRASRVIVVRARVVAVAQASRSMGQVMQRGPPLPRPSSPPGTVITSMPLSWR